MSTEFTRLTVTSPLPVGMGMEVDKRWLMREFCGVEVDIEDEGCIGISAILR